MNERLFVSILSAYLDRVYRNSSIKPPGGLFDFGPSRGGLLETWAHERGAYSQNQVTRICLLAFQFFYPIFAESTYNFKAQIHKFGTGFIPSLAKINMQGCIAK